MSNQNRGKKFELQVKNSFKAVDGCSIDRLPDQTSGFIGSTNICDFTIYKYPFYIYLECKSTSSRTLGMQRISKNQWEGLLEKSKFKGVISGVMIWFIEEDTTIFVPTQSILELKKIESKSISIRNLNSNNLKYYNIKGKKKVVYFDYDMKSFLDELFIDEEVKINGNV